MSELEFQHELSPDQLSEALSLLENAAGAKPRESNSGGEAHSNPDRANADAAEPDRLSAAQDAKRRLKQFNRAALRFCGLGIAAAAALMLLSWIEGVPVAPPGQRVVYAQLPNELWTPPAKEAADTRPAADSPSIKAPRGSEPQPAAPTVAGPDPEEASHDHSPNSVKDAANIPDAASDVAETATPAMADNGKSRRNAWKGQRPKDARRRLRLARIAKVNRSECLLFACLVWQPQHAFYDPPRNLTQ
ncbi:MAG TPA: hypothetical protein VGF34_20670 [Stellaceae bacterium]|jgi:hypothetical protein